VPRARRWKPWLILFSVPVVVALAGIGYLAWRQSVPGPRAEVHAPKFIGVKTPVAVDVKTARGGIAAVDVRVVQGEASAAVAQQAFPAPPAQQRLDLTIAGRDLGLKEGPAVIEVRGRDDYWRPFRRGDQLVASAPVTLKFTPPTLEVLGATQYLHQGGGGLAIIRAKGASKAGVKVGPEFFPAYAVGDSGFSVSLFALPWNLPDAAPITAWAEDEAGNGVSRPLPITLKPRRYAAGTVEITDKFLASKLPELMPERSSIPPEQQVAAFLVVNRDKRKAAEDTKRQIAQKSKPRPLWEGAFVQPRNTQVFSNFAESRSYRYGGKEIDQQVHLGFDLASLKNSPVPAANAGVVAFAGPLTIYGNAVIVDHGLGLATLYGHLSSLAVKEGDEVKQGQELGRSGTTGLATGDHVHYEVLIQGVAVTPVEWWDGKWIRDHIGRPLMEANVPLLQSEYPAQKATPASSDRSETPVKKRRATAIRAR